jgi:hypothetical protein
MVKQHFDPDELFKAAQQPVLWFSGAERLRDAAEIILGDQIKREGPYLEAKDKAGQEAEAAAVTASDGSAQAEIACEQPNYGSAQLLYAFAMENALKGLIVTRNPGSVESPKISNSIKSHDHDLIELARKAHFLPTPKEEQVLKALSLIAKWAGRYPVPLKMAQYVNQESPLGLNRDALLDWGQHPVMRRCFDRMLQELQTKLPKPPNRFGLVVAFRP